MMRSNRARLLFVAASVVALASLRALAGPAGGKDPATRALTIFSDVFALTRSNYVDAVEPKTLLEGAYDGMSDALDSFSYYVPAADRAAYRAHQESGAVDPGIVMARRGGFPYVAGVVPDSPADQAGVKAGDILESVDGKSQRNTPLWKVHASLKGPEGSRLDLSLFRPATEKKLSVRVPRSRFAPGAAAVRFEQDLAILRIPAFTPRTEAEIRKALSEVESKKLSRLLVDVRGAIGGEPADAAAAAGLFTGKGLVARLEARRVPASALQSSAEKVWSGRTIVLLDEATGGAAEVFAAALHDRASAVTVGQTTIGMAIVQRLVPTESGGSLYLTVGRYVSPSGSPIGQRGLAPDERVLRFPDETEGGDPILERARDLARGGEAVRRAA